MQASNSLETSNEKKLDSLGRSYSTGKRKSSIARVWLKRGTGLVKINGKEENKYFSSKSHRILLNQPLVLSQRKSEIDIICTVEGGGLSGQAGAIRHGIARALVKFEPELIAIKVLFFNPLERLYFFNPAKARAPAGSEIVRVS